MGNRDHRDFFLYIYNISAEDSTMRTILEIMNIKYLTPIKIIALATGIGTKIVSLYGCWAITFSTATMT